MDTVDFAIDMETLGTHSGCVVLSIGIVAFNPNSDEIISKKYYEPNIQSQLDDGLKIEADTLAWWAMKEDPEERKILNNYIDVGNEDGSVKSKPHLAGVLKDIQIFYHTHNTDGGGLSRLWCVGTDFDVAMLRYLGHKYGYAYPFNYRAARDLRTFCDALNVDREETPMAEGLKKHNALDDALHCAHIVQYAYKSRSVTDK